MALLSILVLSIRFTALLFLPLIFILLLITMFQLIPILYRCLFLTITTDIDFEPSVHFVIIQIHTKAQASFQSGGIIVLYMVVLPASERVQGGKSISSVMGCQRRVPFGLVCEL